VASLGAVALLLLVPAVAFACKCAPVSIGALDPATNQVYVGVAGAAIPGGTPMIVEAWFSGPGEAPEVLLAASSFGDSASCGIEPLPVGSSWIMSAQVPEPGAVPVTGMCQPHAALETPEGQAMLAEATAAYGPATVPTGGGAVQGEADSATLPLAVLALAIVAGLLVVIVLALRRDRSTQG
jgi:hypothetical protein